MTEDSSINGPLLNLPRPPIYRCHSWSPMPFLSSTNPECKAHLDTYENSVAGQKLGKSSYEAPHRAHVLAQLLGSFARQIKIELPVIQCAMHNGLALMYLFMASEME